jgi:putative colanic acid biosynthesis glycosyltransferase
MDDIAVVHVNVRYESGGAARIMRTLGGAGDSIYYGYGPRGGPSVEADSAGSTKVAARWEAATNRIMHRVVGLDLVGKPTAIVNGIHSLEQAGRHVVLHLHAIHSHMLSLSALRDLLACFDGPVVWTCHDAWVLTGRCAIPGQCRGWTHGCSPCEDLSAYPGAWIDLAGGQFARKRRLLASIADRLCLVAPSAWLMSELDRQLPELSKVLIRNGVDDAIVAADGSLRGGHVLWAGADLSDRRKQDLGIIQSVLDRGQEIRAFGRNISLSHSNLDYRGVLGDRAALGGELAAAKALLFTSRVDNASTLVMESLVNGTPVIAVDSPGNRELLDLIGMRCTPDHRVVDEACAVPDALPRVPIMKARRVFAASEMTARYSELYRNLLSGGP